MKIIYITQRIMNLRSQTSFATEINPNLHYILGMKNP